MVASASLAPPQRPWFRMIPLQIPTVSMVLIMVSKWCEVDLVQPQYHQKIYCHPSLRIRTTHVPPLPLNWCSLAAGHRADPNVWKTSECNWQAQPAGKNNFKAGYNTLAHAEWHLSRPSAPSHKHTTRSSSSVNDLDQISRK